MLRCVGRVGSLAMNERCQSTVANRAARVGRVVGFARPWGGPGGVLLWLRRLTFRASVLIELAWAADCSAVTFERTRDWA